MFQKLFLPAFIFISIAAAGQSKNFIDQPFVEVSGSFDTLLTPNRIHLRISLSERDNKNKISVEEQESKMLSLLKSIGIDTEKDLALADLISNYRFYFLKQKDIYKIKTYYLKIPNAYTAGKVMVMLEEAGISNIQVDKLEHTDLENIRNICRTRAIENARDKATLLARPLQQGISHAINITETENYSNPNTGVFADTRITLRGVRSMSADSNEYSDPGIEFEKIRVRQAVNVKFILNVK